MRPRLSPFLRLQAIGWGLFALVDLVNRQLAYFDLGIALALTAIVYPTMIVLSSALRRIYDRGDPHPPGLPAMLLLSAAGAAATVALLAAMRTAFGWTIPDWRPAEAVILPFIHYAITLFGWSLLYAWLRAEQRRRQAHEAAIAAQAEALRAEIQQLRLQINPHFLFNALNGIAEEVPANQQAALAMLRDLAAYLRHVLAGIRTPIATVAAEAEALAAYLRIQQARFAERLHTALALDPDAAALPIPNALLQPLVENAIVHGDRTSRLDLAIRIARSGAGLAVEITNTGTLAPARSRPASHGLGLENLRRRLALHYPGRHDFTLEALPAASPHPARVRARLRLDGPPCSAS
jgi:LytS/YehU family sensor histidine kinase